MIKRSVAAVALAAVGGAAPAQDAQRGAGLYLQLPTVASCVSCHGPDLLANRNGFLRAADNPQALQKALNAVGVMGYLKPVLTDLDVNDLAAFLGRVAPLASGEAALQAWPLTLEFGSVAFGGVSSVQGVQLRNRGTVPLPIGPLQVQGEGFTLLHDCPGELAPGGACAAQVRFQATGLGGAVGALVLPSAATVQPVLAALGARAVDTPRAALQWSPDRAALDFEPTAPGAQRSTTLTLVNAGTADAVLANTTLIGPQSGAFALAGCAPGSVLAPGERCDLRVDYRPTGSGSAAAVLQLRSDGANPASVALRAAALPAPPPAEPPASSGGGTSDGRWLMWLVLAAAALHRRRSSR